jgi:hypothetical protein
VGLVVEIGSSRTAFPLLYVHTRTVPILGVERDENCTFNSVLKLIKGQRVLIEVRCDRSFFLQKPILLGAFDSKTTLFIPMVRS